jgi:hypothetical protein
MASEYVLTPLDEKLLDLSAPNVSNSLQGDELLLATLQEVSGLILARSARASESVRELGLEATATQVTLQNTMTRMALLANTKFIESVSGSSSSSSRRAGGPGAAQLRCAAEPSRTC